MMFNGQENVSLLGNEANNILTGRREPILVCSESYRPFKNLDVQR